MADLNPSYDITKDYYYNLENGPFLSVEFPKSLGVRKVKIFGKEVDFPLGVPAGLLLNGRWVEAYNRLGFPVVVYKTVRSRQYPCHPMPNCLFVKLPMVDPYNPPSVAVAPEGYRPDSPRRVTITNSFGMPSYPPEVWQEDMERVKERLLPGSLFVGSGVGTYEGTWWELKRDFVRVASMLREVGVDAVILNLSCPNVGQGEGAIYTDAEASSEILREVRRAVRDVPLMVKVGLLLGDRLEEFVKRCVYYVEGISGVNSLQMRVVNDKGEPALGRDRKLSGVCGWSLRRCAQEFTKQLALIRERMKAEFLIFSCGGVTDRESFEELIGCGADVVMSCTGAMFNPRLAAEIRGDGEGQGACREG